jgi:hypothetical protein
MKTKLYEKSLKARKKLLKKDRESIRKIKRKEIKRISKRLKAGVHVRVNTDYKDLHLRYFRRQGFMLYSKSDTKYLVTITSEK